MVVVMLSKCSPWLASWIKEMLQTEIGSVCSGVDILPWIFGYWTFPPFSFCSVWVVEHPSVILVTCRTCWLVHNDVESCILVVKCDAYTCLWQFPTQIRKWNLLLLPLRCFACLLFLYTNHVAVRQRESNAFKRFQFIILQRFLCVYDFALCFLMARRNKQTSVFVVILFFFLLL